MRGPFVNDVPHSRPFIGEAEVVAASSVLRSLFLAQGPVGAELEEAWCAQTGMAAAACVGSGVGALRLGLLALGIGPGDEVVVPAYSCVALLNAPLALDARPVLADVEIDDWTLSVDDVQRRLTPASRAIVAVNLFGMPSRLAELADLGLPVIEDCAHGIGGQTSAGPFGGGSEVSMSSFYATKMIGAGEGGIVAASRPELVERVRRARDYGDQLPSADHLNDKMTDVEAAIALSQLNRLGEILRLRAERAAVYEQTLAPLAEQGLVVLPESNQHRIWYRYAARLLRHDAAEVCDRMTARGVHAERPVWDLSASEFWRDDLDGSTEAFRRVISLPLFPGLGHEEQARVCEALADCLEGS